MKNFINFLPPWVETNIQPAFYDKESGTCLQQTARMYAKVNQLVRAVNGQNETIADYINKFIELKEFVDDYFDNLDVQEEVNNKLDAMTEDGTLGTLIGSYVDDYVATTNNRLSSVESTLDTKLPQYKTLTSDQYLSLTFPRNTSIQGMCADDNNNLYVYVVTTPPYGDLYKYNLVTHSYVGKFENLKLHHGNDMIYKDGKIYVAPVKADDGTMTNKTIDIYDVTTGTVSTINPFSALSWANVATLCDYDENNIIVGLNAFSASSNTVDLKLYKLNLNTLDYVEIEKQWFAEVEPSRAVSINFINGKFYILAESPEYMFAFDYDDEAHTVTNTKIYEIPRKNELGLEIGEFQGLGVLPSGLYGNETFIYSSFNIYNEVGGDVNYTVYLSNLQSDLVGFMGDADDTNVLNHMKDIHVKASATTLLENGTSDYPFHDINTAISYANANKEIINWIYIDDSESYNVGRQCNKNFNIRPKDGTVTPTVRIAELHDCHVKLLGATMTVEKTSTSATAITIENTHLVMKSVVLKSAIEASYGCEVYTNNITLTVDYNVTNVFDLLNSTANFYIGTINGTGTYTRLIRATEGSTATLNHSHQSEPTGIGAGSIITVTSS